jgi:hypothetical protein
MPCEPGKHTACLPGSQGIFLHIHGRLEDLFSIPEQFDVFYQREVKEKENRTGASGEFLNGCPK